MNPSQIMNRATHRIVLRTTATGQSIERDVDNKCAVLDQEMFEIMDGSFEGDMIIGRDQIYTLYAQFNVIHETIGADLSGKFIMSIFSRSFEHFMDGYAEGFTKGKDLFFKTRIVPLLRAWIFESYQNERVGRTGTVSGGIEYLYELAIEAYLNKALRREQMISGIRRRRASAVIQDSYVHWTLRPRDGHTYRRAERSYNSLQSNEFK